MNKEYKFTNVESAKKLMYYLRDNYNDIDCDDNEQELIENLEFYTKNYPQHLDTLSDWHQICIKVIDRFKILYIKKDFHNTFTTKMRFEDFATISVFAYDEENYSELFAEVCNIIEMEIEKEKHINRFDL